MSMPKRLRESKTWYAKLLALEDRYAGTPYDALIESITGTITQMEREHPGKSCFRESYRLPDGTFDLDAMDRDAITAFGYDFAVAVSRLDPGPFLRFAEALQRTREHQRARCEDKLRSAVLLFCTPPDRVFAMRDIIAHLVKVGIVKEEKNSTNYDGLRRLLRRFASDAGIKIKGTSGRPKETRRKRRKKPGRLS